MTATIQPYVPISRRPLDLEDYVAILKRHSGWILAPAYIGLVISIVIACSLQNVYTASARMQIQPSQISDNVVPTTVNQRLTERIDQLRGIVTSRERLAQALQDQRLNIYTEEKAKLPLEDVEDLMRKDIGIYIDPEAATRRGGSEFAITFSYRKRKEAQQTVSWLVNQFITESKSTENVQQKTLNDFISDQLNQARADLEKKNEALTAFRKANEGRLPEQENVNITQINALQARIGGIMQELNRLQNEKVTLETHVTYLKNQMALTDAFQDDNPGPSSPIYRENQELQKLDKDIDDTEFRLRQLRQMYRANYPDIRIYQNQLSLMKKRRDDLAARQEKERAEEAAKPQPQQKKPTDNKLASSRLGIQGEIDHYNALLHNNNADQEARRKELDQLNRDEDDYRARLKQTTLLEAQYADLVRDQKLASAKYDSMEHKQDLTKESADLVSRGATENLTVLDPASVPQNPARPQRLLIVGAGFAVSLVLGLVLAGVQEAKDTSLKNLKDVRAYTNLPVLCSVPLLENTLLVKRKRRVTYVAWASALVLGILAVSGALFYYFTVIKNS
jgi:uncharacterized protein involved in exopolysaccharide biosynthesis